MIPTFELVVYFINLDRFGVIVNQYCGIGCGVGGFVVTQSYGQTNTHTILAITGLNFVNNGASFGIKLTIYELTNTQYKFKVNVLN